MKLKIGIFVAVILSFLVGAGTVYLFAGYRQTHNVIEPTEVAAETKQEEEPEIKIPSIGELLELTNAERAKVGVKPLILDERLNKSSEDKRLQLERDGWDDFAHDEPSGKRGYEYVFDYWPTCKLPSENLHRTLPIMNIDGSMAKAWIATWMNSEPHKKAILNPDYDYVGFAFSKDVYQTIYVVQHFCDAY